MTGTAFMQEAARFYAEADPVAAARTFAAGLRLQSRGGRVTAARIVLEELTERDPGLVADLREIVRRLP